MKCARCGFALTFDTNGEGRVVEACTRCVDREGCRRCVECGLRVTGKYKRCPVCWLERRRELSRRYEDLHRETRRRADRARRRRWSPEKRRTRALQQKRWRVTHPKNVALCKRKGRLLGTSGYRSREAYLEAQRQQNRRRAEQKRIWMHRYRVYRDGKVPRCRVCGEPVPWHGRGRPRARCTEHRSAA